MCFRGGKKGLQVLSALLGKDVARGKIEVGMGVARRRIVQVNKRGQAIVLSSYLDRRLGSRHGPPMRGTAPVAVVILRLLIFFLRHRGARYQYP